MFVLGDVAQLLDDMLVLRSSGLVQLQSLLERACRGAAAMENLQIESEQVHDGCRRSTYVLDLGSVLRIGVRRKKDGGEGPQNSSKSLGTDGPTTRESNGPLKNQKKRSGVGVPSKNQTVHERVKGARQRNWVKKRKEPPTIPPFSL